MSTPPIELSCVIPAYNEEPCLRPVLRELVAAADARGIAYELIVIDNGSVDRSRQVLEEVQRTVPALRIIRFEQNRGYGGAIHSGMAAARGAYISFTAADGELPAESLMRVYDEVRAGRADLCKTRRLRRHDGVWRKLLTLGYALVARLFFRLTTWDVNGYPVCMTRAVYERLQLTKTDFTLSLEMLYRAQQHRFRVAEVPVQHRKRLGGASHIRWYTALLMLWELLKFWRHVRREQSPRPAERRVV